MIRRRALALVALALCALAPTPPGKAARGGALRSGAFEPARPAPELALPATTGGEFRLSRQHGKVIALTFGYTSCPDICPTVLAELAQVRVRLGGAARRVQVAYVTVDPDRDSPARLRAYTEPVRQDLPGPHRHRGAAGRGVEGLRGLGGAPRSARHPGRRCTCCTTPRRCS